MNRRNFNKLAMAALGGALAGAGLSQAADKDKPAAKPMAKDPKKPLLLQEPHVCKGLNTCKNKGKSGKNACAGQGTCHTAPENSCGGMNTCAGLGGCGATPGENACKGKGKCHVPLEAKAWAKARKRFEEEAAKAKPVIKVGPAPK